MTPGLREALARLETNAKSWLGLGRRGGLRPTRVMVEHLETALVEARAALAASEPTPASDEPPWDDRPPAPHTLLDYAEELTIAVNADGPDVPMLVEGVIERMRQAASEGAGEGLDAAKRAELIAFHGQQCNRVVNGYCGTGRCLKRGGYSGAGSVDYNAATCEAWETIQALAAPAPPAAQPPPAEPERRNAEATMDALADELEADLSPAPPASDDGEGARYVVRENPAPPPVGPSPWAPWQVVSTDHPTETLVMCGCWWEGAARKIADALNAASAAAPPPEPAAPSPSCLLGRVEMPGKHCRIALDPECEGFLEIRIGGDHSSGPGVGSYLEPAQARWLAEKCLLWLGSSVAEIEAQEAAPPRDLLERVVRDSGPALVESRSELAGWLGRHRSSAPPEDRWRARADDLSALLDKVLFEWEGMLVILRFTSRERWQKVVGGHRDRYVEIITSPLPPPPAGTEGGEDA